MDSFIKTLCICLFIFVMTVTVPPVVDFIKATSEKNGDMGTASYYPITETEFGYSLSYNLDGGTADNPAYYGLYSPTFTLNNPSKLGYEFTGWTGSNGDTPQLTVTICTGSAGDLEFTANYKQVIELTIDENGLTWTTIDGLTEFDVYVNDNKFATITERFLELSELNAYCSEGINNICVKSGTATSNVVEYNYIDLTAFENLTFNVNFSRSSEGYSFGLGSVGIGYTYAGEQKGGFIDNNVYEENLTIEEHFFKQLNIKRNYSTLKLLNTTLFEIAEQINLAYIDGTTEMLVDVSNKFYFVIEDEFNTNYTPQKMYLNVTYTSMLDETTFYEGCTVKLNDCFSGNSFDISEVSLLGVGCKHSACIYLESTPETKRIDYEVNITNGGKYFFIGSVSYSSALSEDEFNAYLKNCKFYLNSEYYFKIKGNFSDFYKKIYADVAARRYQHETSIGNNNPNEWGFDEITYTLDITEYFDVYTNDGVLVDFEYTLQIDCLTRG